MSVSNWFKATQRRMKETILQSVGAHDKTDDGLFDEKYQSFVVFSRDLAKVHLSLQLWLDSMDLLCASSVGIGESLSTFCASSQKGEDSPLLDVARAFHAISADFNTIMRTNMRSVFIDRCLKPIESILSIVPIVNDKMQKRKHLRLDNDFYRSKLASEQSAGKGDDHPAVVKIAAKLSDATKALDAVTMELVSCIDELNCQKEFMLGPEMAAMVACMQTFYAFNSSHLSKLTPMIPQSASTSCLLLATFESQKSLGSQELICNMKAKTSTFPMQPVFLRPQAQGGSAGGYGHTPLISGSLSKVDALLSNSTTHSGTSGVVDVDGSANSGLEARNSSPATLGSSIRGQSPDRPVSSQRTAKRPVIKLGTDTSTSSTGGSHTSAGESVYSRRASTSSFPLSRSTQAWDIGNLRPLSMPSGPPPPIPTPAVGLARNGKLGQRPNSVKPRGSISSLRLTASAAALSGSPKSSLGVADTSFDEREESEEFDNRWNDQEGRKGNTCYCANSVSHCSTSYGLVLVNCYIE